MTVLSLDVQSENCEQSYIEMKLQILDIQQYQPEHYYCYKRHTAQKKYKELRNICKSVSRVIDPFNILFLK
jgi:hypothetical protein